MFFLARKISVKNFVCAHSTGAFYNDTASLPSPPRGGSVVLVDILSKKESWAFKGNKCSSGSILCKLQRDSETSTVWTHFFLMNQPTSSYLKPFRQGHDEEQEEKGDHDFTPDQDVPDPKRVSVLSHHLQE